MTIFLDRHAAATGSADDGFGARLDVWPPGIDVAAHEVAAFLLGVEVKTHRAATASIVRQLHRDAKSIEYACRGGIDIRGNGRLHTTIQQ